MKIRRFNESEEIKISPEKITDILKNLNEFASMLEKNEKMVESFSNEFVNYQSSSVKSNTQIDESLIQFQQLKKSLENSIENVNNIVNNLQSYNQEGSQEIYKVSTEK